MTHKVVVSPDWFGYIRVSSQLCCSSSWALRGWEKREKKCFSGLFRSLKKKKKNVFILRTRTSSVLISSLQESKVKSRIPQRERRPVHNAGLSWVSPWPHTATCFSFRRFCCRYRAWSTSGDFVLGLWSSAYSDTSRRNGTKSPWKSECNNFQAYCNYLNSNNNPITLFSKLFLTYRNRQGKK